MTIFNIGKAKRKKEYAYVLHVNKNRNVNLWISLVKPTFRAMLFRFFFTFFVGGSFILEQQ